MQTCAVCSHQNPAGVEYCEDCGAALATTPPAPAAAGAVGSTASVPAPAGSPASSPPSPPQAPASTTGTGPTGGTGAAPTSAPSVVESGPVVVTPATSATSTTGPDGAPLTPPVAPAPAPAGPARLVVKRFGAVTQEEVPLAAERLVVGRFDPETGPVDIDLSASPEANHISRQHGELFRDADGRWTVRDLGSTNGVFVKAAEAASFGPRITAPRPLVNGEEVAFGNARFIFRTD